MANQNFVVHNGLTVGPLTIDATTGSINTTGNITTTGTTTTFINEIVTGTEAVYGNLTANSGYISISTTTGALQVTGGAGITGTVFAGQFNTAGNILSTGAVHNSLTVNGTASTGSHTPLTSNTYTLGSSSLWWSSMWGLAVNAQYAELAEKYQADAAYEPGTVLMFGGTQEVTLADIDTNRVAGVVSTQPGYLMNGSLANETAIELALTGRVPCKVVGLVRKGDLMTSAGNGYAHANPDPKVGTVIGKALENFDGSEGVIEVVVGKH